MMSYGITSTETGSVSILLGWNPKNGFQLPSMMSKRSHHFIKLLMLTGVSFQQRISFNKDIIGLQCISSYGCLKP